MFKTEEDILKDEFKKAINTSIGTNYKVIEIVEVLFKEYNIDLDKWLGKTPLGKTPFYNLKNGIDVEMESIVIMAITFKIPKSRIDDLLRAYGLSFRHTKKEHIAYEMLIERHGGKSMTECNEMLEKTGIDKKHWLKDDI